MNKKNILIFGMIIFALLQSFYVNKFNSQESIGAYGLEDISYNHKSLKEISEELNCLKEKNILSANEVDGKWYIKVKIKGDKKDLLEELSKLTNYNITNYIINKNENEKSIIVEISSKDVV